MNRLVFPVEVFGMKFNSIKECYRELNFPCCYDTLIRKVKNIEDYSKGKVLEELLGGSSRTVYILGVRCNSFNDACRKFGTDVNKGQIRRKRGWGVVDSVLGKAKGKRVLSKDVVKVVLKDRLIEGWGYDEALQFFDGDDICGLDAESEILVRNFFDMCEYGKEPMNAFVDVFGG